MYGHWLMVMLPLTRQWRVLHRMHLGCAPPDGARGHRRHPADRNDDDDASAPRSSMIPAAHFPAPSTPIFSSGDNLVSRLLVGRIRVRVSVRSRGRCAKDRRRGGTCVPVALYELEC